MKILVPFDNREAVTLAIAAFRASRSVGTIRNWCEQHGIGRRIGGQWRVSRVALEMFLDGNSEALNAYHRGERDKPPVAEYFERCGMQTKNTKNANPAISA